MRVKTKLKMNKINDLSGWKYEFIKHAGKDLESSISKMPNKVAKYVTIPNE